MTTRRQKIRRVFVQGDDAGVQPFDVDPPLGPDEVEIDLGDPPDKIGVYKDPYAQRTNEDGSPRLFTLCRITNPPCVLVHPDNWDAFLLALREHGIELR